MSTPTGKESAGRNEGAERLPVVSETNMRLSSSPLDMSAQLTLLAQRARTGNAEDIDKLAKWSSLVEQEGILLRKRLRKQQHDFATLFEIVGQTSARSLDVVAMQTYLLRTVSGHFATTRLIILRRLRVEDVDLTCSASQGVATAACSLPIDSALCRHSLERRTCFSLKDIADRNGTIETFEKMGLDLVVPLVQDLEGGAVLEGMLMLGPRLAGHAYTDEDVEFLQVLGKMLAICFRNEALYRRSIIDDLTGVASRGHFDAQLSQELNRIITYGHKSLGLLMLDVDKFKSFNDTYGHPTGDKILQELAKVLVHQVRNVDLVARYGGEEFAIILLEIDRVKVQEVADRLRRAVENMQVTSAHGDQLKITCSFGAAVFPDDAVEKSTLIQLADEALYRSKANGRNRVTMTVPGAGLSKPGTEMIKPLPPKKVDVPHSPAPKPAGLSGTWAGVSAAEMELRKQQRALTENPEDSLMRDERRRTAIRIERRPPESRSE